MKHSLTARRGLTGLALLAILALPAWAAEPTLDTESVYCFSQSDFQSDGCYGVMLTDVPARTLGTLMLGSRTLQAGDALPTGRLEELTFVPAGRQTGDAVISCLRVTDLGPTPYQLTLKIGAAKNEPPVAENSDFQTYKNIAGQVPLTISDPEGEPLTVTIVKEPKRGDVTIEADGTVTYTPLENKVGRDSFTYTVSDPAGNVSEEATVRVEILKPSDKRTYGEMAGDPAELAAVWLREEGIFSGETVSGTALFYPERTVTRGEFLAMCAGLMGQGPGGEVLSTGFADEADTPEWLSPHVSTALRCGYLTGMPSAEGLVLNASEQVTQAQAVKMVSGMLGLRGSDSETVMAAERSVPAWAAASVSAMAEADLFQVTDPNQALTRREAALLLYHAARYSSLQETSLLSWAAK